MTTWFGIRFGIRFGTRFDVRFRARLVALLAVCLIAGSCSLTGEGELLSGSPESTAAPAADAGPESESTPEPEPEVELEPEPEVRPESEGNGDDELRLTPTLTEEELSLRLSELEGRLAVGLGPELAVVRPDGGRVELLDGSETVLAAQPTWSHDGRQLAWSSVSAERQAVFVQPFDGQGVPEGDPSQASASGTPIFYLQWNDSDERLAYIRNSATPGTVEVGVIDPGLPIAPVGQGAPFFVSWSPSADRILGHVNDSTVARYDAEPDAAGAGASGFTTVSPLAGGFSAPVWVDEERALIVNDNRLVYLDATSGAIEPLIDLDGPIRFVLSPDRTKLAYQAATGGGGATRIVQPIQNSGGLTVLNLITLEQTPVTDRAAAAWEWSPDSTTLAWLEAQLIEQRPAGRWNFWSDAASPAMAQSQWFQFTRKYVQSYLPFFAQYTQSVTGWAPDSSAFAFAGVIGRDRGVWIQLVDEVVAPRIVAPGDFVTWGPGEPPPPSRGASAA